MMAFTKRFLYIVIAACLFGCSINDDSKQVPAGPNIILITADDLGWSDIGCYGSEVNTPNLDKLAEQGLRFTQFHNTSKCFPSRAALVTGVYAQDCGYAKTHLNPIQHAVTIGEMLQPAGYLTYWSGKHHGIENPFNRGFDHFYGINDGGCNHFNPGLQRPGEPKPAQKRNNRSWCFDSLTYAPFTPEDPDFYTTDNFTDYAIQFLEEAGDKQEPFFLYLAFTAPHDPLMVWPADIAKYKGMYDEGYEVIRRKRYEKQLRMGLIDSIYTLSPASHDPWQDLSIAEKEFEASKMEVYAAMIDRLDQNVGRVLQRLKELNLDENTMIMFASDNGASAEVVNLKNDNDHAAVGAMDRWVSLGPNWANVGNTPFRYFKNYSYEGGINTPMIMWWPKKIQPNTFTGFPGHFIDIAATLVDITGAPYPTEVDGNQITPLQGISLLPLFDNQIPVREQPLFWSWSDGKAMRKEEWKIVKEGEGSSWELYNTLEDPTETANLANKFPGKLVVMDSIYTKWISQFD